MLLSVKAVSHFYGSRLVFKGVSLDAPRASVTLLAGANGAGKSTLLKIMAGLISPTSGTVEYGKGEEDPRIGYLGHQTFIYPEMTASENLLFWASLHNQHVDVSAALERVELAAFAEEKAGGFSRGMAQRLNLARVFMLQPDMLLLDEPGTGLDTRSTAILHREIAAMRERGAAVIWITHSLEADLTRADRVALLEGKRLAFTGSVEDFSAGQEVLPEPAATREARGGEPC